MLKMFMVAALVVSPVFAHEGDADHNHTPAVSAVAPVSDVASVEVKAPVVEVPVLEITPASPVSPAVEVTTSAATAATVTTTEATAATTEVAVTPAAATPATVTTEAAATPATTPAAATVTTTEAAATAATPATTTATTPSVDGGLFKSVKTGASSAFAAVSAPVVAAWDIAYADPVKTITATVAACYIAEKLYNYLNASPAPVSQN